MNCCKVAPSARSARRTGPPKLGTDTNLGDYAVNRVCLAKTSYTCRMNDLVKDWFGFFRYNSCHDCVAPTFPRLVGQRFPFPGGPRPREPGSPSAIAGSARATTPPSIDCPPQPLLASVHNL